MMGTCTCVRFEWNGPRRMRSTDCPTHGISDRAYLDQLHAAVNDPQHRWPEVAR